ncbi:hypothetical protein [Natronococcus sp.]|uniref:hypothetical protein n=1 Tax=Natronococcus sp. TaxID=35747 RepID=UPI0025D561CC|nr:hypothetical protein [Natronococcus sp.]
MTVCNATVPDKDASGDNLYGDVICSQTYIDYFWETYGFEGNKSYWDDGFGWENPCDTSKPLARTFNACYLLTYSAEDYRNDDWDAPMLNWARRYVRENTSRHRAKCGDGSAIAASFRGWFIKNRVELYRGFFFKHTVPERAGTLVHEARHQGGKSHNDEFPPGSIYGEGRDGADSDWDFQGAWMYNALYLWWFYAEGARTTSAMKQRAKHRGNLIINNAFAEHPGFTI